jgi:hypothetical protein
MVPWWVAVITSTVLPIATLVLGCFLNQKSEQTRGKRVARREDRLDLEQRSEARRQRREEFELRVLTDLHPALMRYARAVARFHLEDLRAARSTNSLYAAHQLNVGDLAEELRLANLQLTGLNDLVLNEEIRTSIRHATVSAFELSFKPKSIEKAMTLYDEFTTRMALATELIGEAIRTLYMAPVDEGITPGSERHHGWELQQERSP